MDECREPLNNTAHEIIKTSLNIASGLVPFAGGILSAISASWSEHVQEKMNEFLKYRQNMLENEVKEQLQTIHEVTLELDRLKKDVSNRIKSTEFQSLVNRCFRNWSGISSESKREYIRNILVNAASTGISNDDVIRLFIDWINLYSELHFQVVACIYKHPKGIDRGQIWQYIGKPDVREDSADADLYKLLIRDLSTGGIIRQYRPTDYNGNFIAMPTATTKPKSRAYGTSKILESAFDTSKLYVLTDLGQQFVHYTMSDVSIKIEHQEEVLL